MKAMKRIERLKLPSDLSKEAKLVGGVSAVVIAVGWNSTTEREEILLTKRTDTVMTHKGQVGFPGGVWEKVDGSLFETALREAEEEVGLKRSDIEVLGALAPVTTRGDVWIYPWVAQVNFPYQFQASAAEVAKILMLPVETLIEQGLKKVEIEMSGRRIQSIGIEWEGELIWGATARMLEDLRKYLL